MGDGDAMRAGRRRAKEMREIGWYRDARLTWASGARASSSYGGGWSPTAALGPPRVYPRYGDLPGAWAPKQPAETSNSPEWLEVDFAPGTRARAVWIFETNHAGAVVSVVDETQGSAVLWSGKRQELHSAQVLVVPVDPPREIRRLRIHVSMDGYYGFPEIDAVALVRDAAEEQQRKIDWRKERWRPVRTKWANVRLALAFAAATATTWSCIAPSGLVVGTIAPRRVASGMTYAELTPRVEWASDGRFVDGDIHEPSLVGPPDEQLWRGRGAERLSLAVASFAPEVHAASVVLVETRPFAVVRIDDVSSPLRPVTIWRGATSEPRRGDHGVVRIDLPEPRVISRLRLVVDREIARGSVDAIGVVPL